MIWTQIVHDTVDNIHLHGVFLQKVEWVQQRWEDLTGIIGVKTTPNFRVWYGRRTHSEQWPTEMQFPDRGLDVVPQIKLGCTFLRTVRVAPPTPESEGYYDSHLFLAITPIYFTSNAHIYSIISLLMNYVHVYLCF